MICLLVQRPLIDVNLLFLNRELVRGCKLLQQWTAHGGCLLPCAQVREWWTAHGGCLYYNVMSASWWNKDGTRSVPTTMCQVGTVCYGAPAQSGRMRYRTSKL